MKETLKKYLTHKNIFIIYSIVSLLTFSFFVWHGIKVKNESKRNNINEIDEEESNNEVDNNPEKDIKKIFEKIFTNNNDFESVATLEKNVDDFNDLSMQEKTNIAYWDYNFSAYNSYDGVKVLKEDIEDYIGFTYKDPFKLGDNNVYSIGTNLTSLPIFLYNKEKEYYYGNDKFQEELNKKQDSRAVYSTELNILSVQRTNDIYVVTTVRRWEIEGEDKVILDYLSVYDTFSNALSGKNPLFEIPSNINDYYQYYLDNFNKYKDKMARYIYTFEKVDNQYLLVSFKFEDR